MKTAQRADGLYIEEACGAIEVVWAGLAALVDYFDMTAPTGPYLMRAFMMCESYCGMLEAIASQGDHARYQDLMLHALDRIRDNREAGRSDAGEVLEPADD